MHHKLNYTDKLKPFARKLRIEGTQGEAILWLNALKAGKMYGYQILRFSEAEVVHRLDEVVGTISYAVETLEQNN